MDLPSDMNNPSKRVRLVRVVGDVHKKRKAHQAELGKTDPGDDEESKDEQDEEDEIEDELEDELEVEGCARCLERAVSRGGQVGAMLCMMDGPSIGTLGDIVEDMGTAAQKMVCLTEIEERRALAELVAEVAGRLSDTAEKLDEHGRRSRELAEEGLEEIRRQQRWFEEMDQRSEARLGSQEARRTARLVSREARRPEREHAQDTRQDKEAAAAAKEHEDMVNVLSANYPYLPKDETLPWSSYEEFWSCVDRVPAVHQRCVTEQAPRLADLISIAREKNFRVTLKEAGLPAVLAARIANFIHLNVYEK